MLYINFKKNKELFPLVGTFFIIVGLLKQIIYYNEFNLKIVAFLDFTEILTVFLWLILTASALGYDKESSLRGDSQSCHCFKAQNTAYSA